MLIDSIVSNWTDKNDKNTGSFLVTDIPVSIVMTG